jgi:hypothetical protein
MSNKTTFTLLTIVCAGAFFFGCSCSDNVNTVDVETGTEDAGACETGIPNISVDAEVTHCQQ